MISILILMAFIAGLTFIMDADFITYFYHLYRTKYKPKCFKNKTIWIVGASSGLGEYLVYRACVNDAKCIIISSRRKEQLQRVADKANKDYNANTKIIIVPIDLLKFIEPKSGASDCQEFITQVIKDNGIDDIDYLVLNTGITARALGMNTELSVFNKLINLNVYAIVTFTQSFIATLRKLSIIKSNNTNHKKRGIYVTSSVAGLVGSPGQVAYAASKHAINGYLKSLRYELVRDNINIGIVCPGPFRPTENSHDGLGGGIDESSGRLLKKDTAKKKMTSERAAKLFVSAMCGQLTESWLAYNPYLLFCYIQQYLPFVRSLIVRFVGPMRLKEILHKQKKKETKTTTKGMKKME